MHEVEGPAVIVEQLMCIAKPSTGLHRDVDRVLQRKRFPLGAEGFHDLLEIRPIDELHHDEVAVVRLADIEHADDVRVVEPSTEPRLVEEHPDEVRVGR
jgi:hypothetical protein